MYNSGKPFLFFTKCQQCYAYDGSGSQERVHPRSESRRPVSGSMQECWLLTSFKMERKTVPKGKTAAQLGIGIARGTSSRCSAHG